MLYAFPLVLVIAYLLWTLSNIHTDYARILAQQAKDHEIERDKLLNRIQAPALAVASTIMDPDPVPKHIPLEDDEAMIEYFRERG